MIELFLRYSVSLCEKTAYDILFTFDKLGILMQFSCYHIPYHSIDWKATRILTTCDNKGQLNLLEHAAIKTLKPAMNIQYKGSSINSCWNPLLPKIVASFRDISADIEI